jgi:hypothetical protein
VSLRSPPPLLPLSPSRYLVTSLQQPVRFSIFLIALQVAYLLIFGDLPTSPQLRNWYDILSLPHNVAACLVSVCLSLLFVSLCCASRFFGSSQQTFIAPVAYFRQQGGEDHDAHLPAREFGGPHEELPLRCTPHGTACVSITIIISYLCKCALSEASLVSSLRPLLPLSIVVFVFFFFTSEWSL